MANGDDYGEIVSTLGLGGPPPSPEKYDPLKARIIRNAAQAGVPPEVAEDFRHVITKIESGGKHLSGGTLLRSDMGAQGVSQVMPDKGSANIRTVGGRKYDLTDFDQNLQAGLKYFAEGGNDPVGRRLYYFGGPGARNYYQKHGTVPPGGEWATDKKTGRKYLRTSFRTYIDKTTPKGGFARSLPPPAEVGGSAEPADYDQLVNALGVNQASQQALLAPVDTYTTRLTPEEEEQFHAWRQRYAPTDTGEDYDLRGAFRAGLKPDTKTGHWPDTFKKPNHPTFSNESQYATGANLSDAGHWKGDTFVQPKSQGRIGTEGKFTPVSVLKPTGSIPEPPKVEGAVEKVTPPHTGRVGEIVSLGPTAEKSYREFIHRNVRPQKGASAQTVDAAFKDESNAKYFLTIQDALSKNPKATQKQQTNILARIGLDYLKDPDTKGKLLPNILHSAMLANRWHPDDYKQLPPNLRQQLHVQREQRRQQILASQSPFAGVRAGVGGQEPIGFSAQGQPSRVNQTSDELRVMKGEQPTDRQAYSRQQDDQARAGYLAPSVADKEREAVEQEANYQRDKPEIDRLAKKYRAALKSTGAIPESGPGKWTAEALASGLSPWALKFAGTIGKFVAAGNAPGAQAGVDAMRIHALAMQQAAEAEGMDRNKASKLVQHLVSGTIASAPELAAMSVGLPPVLAFGAGAAAEASGADRPVGPAAIQGALQGAAWELPGVGKGLTEAATKGIGTGLATTGLDLAAGATPEKAITSGITNALMRGVPAVKTELTNRSNARQAESQPIVPETEATKQHQLKALTEGREQVVMIPPNDSVPEVPQGFEVEKTTVGSFIFDPNKIARNVIQAKVENDTWHELLGHIEKKSPETTDVVTARAPTGEEQKSSVVSPENTEVQATELKARYPDAAIEVGEEGQAQKVIDERVEPSVREGEDSFAAARRYYEDRLADPELVLYAVSAESPEGNLFAVPIGGSRKTGASSVLYSKPEGEKLLAKIQGLPGFEKARLRPAGNKFSLEWGGPEVGNRSETNPTEKIGRAYGYSEEAIADFIKRKHTKPSPQVEAVNPKSGAKKEVTNESTAELVAGAKSTTSEPGAVAAPTPFPELPPVAKSEPAFITAARERLASEKAFKEAGGEKRGSGGPDTQPLIDHLLVHGWDAYQAGKVKFSEWSTEMTRRFGEDIEPHLKAAWAQLTGKADEAPEFNWSAREEGGEWKILNPKGEEVSRVSDRKVAEQIVKDMRESDVSPQGQSLVPAIRRQGIALGTDSKGELSYFTNKESGSAGIINNKSGRSAQDVARALAEEGYGLGDWAEVNPKTGIGYEINLNRFREAVQEEVSGRKKHYSTESQPDYEAEYRQRAQSEVDEHDADGTVSLLENEPSGVLYDKIASGKATPSEILEFRQHANKLGVSGEAQDKLIASARETGIQEAGAAPAEKPVNAESEGDTLKSTAAKREKVTEDRKARDEAPIPKPERKSDETLLADAKAANAKDPTEPMRLVDQVLNGEKSLSDTEVVQVDLHRQELKNKYDAVNKELDAATDAAKIGELSDRSDDMEREMRMSEEADATSNTAIARALRAARITVDQDFRLLTMVSRAIKARERALTNAERATIKEQHAKIEKLEADLVEANDRAAKNEATKAVGRIKADVAKENRRAGRGLRKQSLDSEAAELKSLIAQAWKKQRGGGGSTIQPLMGLAKLDPEGVVTKLVVQLARNRLEANVGLRAEALVDEVHTLLKDVVDLSRRDVAEMISGYGKTFEMSQDKIDIKLRELKSIIASNLGKSDIIEKGIRPLRRGMQRDKPTQEVRQAMRELRDTLREHGMQVERSKGSPEEQQKSSLDAAKTQTRNRIEDLTKWIADGKRTVAKKTEIIPDTELRDLRTERDRLQTMFEAIKDPAADQKAIESAVQSAQKSINDLEAKIRGGNLAPKTRQGSPTSPELDAARAQQKALRGILNDLRNAAKPEPDAIEVEARKLLSANKALSTRMEKQIADLTRRMAQGDFSETAKRERAVYNKENLALEKQLNEIKREYAKANYKATRGRYGMVKDELAKAANVPKTIKSMGDISAMFRQGGFYAISNPIEGGIKPTADMLRSFTEVGYENVNQMIRDSKNFELLKRMGVKFSGVEKDNLHQEEGFFGGGTIDVIGSGKYNPLRMVKGVKNFSERTFNAFLDSQRMHIGNQMIDGLLDPGIMARTLGAKPRTIGQVNKAAMGKDFTRIGDLINSGTGRGSLGKYDNAAPFLNIFMFSPRLLKSRVDLMMNMFKPFVLKNMDSAVRAQMIKDNVKFLAGTMAVMAVATAAGGTVNRDPDDADFLKIRFGKTTFDTLTGLQQPLRYIINMTRAAIGDETYVGKDMWDQTFGNKAQGGGFIPSKASPIAGAALESVRGVDFTGRHRSKTERLVDLITPLPAKDFWEAMQKEGLVKGFFKATPALTGIGVQTYDEVPEPKTQAEKLARKLGYHPDKQRTGEEIDKSRKLGELRQKSRKGEDVAAELRAIGATEKQTDAILAAKDTTQLQGLVKPLGMKEAFTVYDAATPEEKKDIRQILVDKYWRAADQGFPNKTKAEADEIKAKAKKLGLITDEAPAAKPRATPSPKSDYEQMRQLLGTP